MTALRLAPIDLADARAWIQRIHSHLDAPIGGKVAVAVERYPDPPSDDAPRAVAWKICCVALLGRPVSRELQAQGCAEVVRVASDKTPHAASKALAAIARAALALGYTRIVSSTLLGEAGTMYRAAGWRPVACDLRERGWKRSDGERAAAMQPGAKVRWEYGPDARPEDPEVAALVLEMAGKIVLKTKRESLPLFAHAGSALTHGGAELSGGSWPR